MAAHDDCRCDVPWVAAGLAHPSKRVAVIHAPGPPHEAAARSVTARLTATGVHVVEIDPMWFDPFVDHDVEWSEVPDGSITDIVAVGEVLAPAVALAVRCGARIHLSTAGRTSPGGERQLAVLDTRVDGIRRFTTDQVQITVDPPIAGTVLIGGRWSSLPPSNHWTLSPVLDPLPAIEVRADDGDVHPVDEFGLRAQDASLLVEIDRRARRARGATVQLWRGHLGVAPLTP